MAASPHPKDVERLLGDLCVKFGFSMASRNAARFQMLDAGDVDIFTEAVFEEEGLDFSVDKSLYSQVRAYVAARLQAWRDRSDV
jgi:hypothetical protein